MFHFLVLPQIRQSIFHLQARLASVGGLGVSVDGSGVKVAVGGGVTCNKSLSPGIKPPLAKAGLHCAS
jgi:hypothetical protein